MEAAFARLVILPPPAPGPPRLPRRDCSGAGLAADRREAQSVERVDRNAFGRAEIGDPLARPVEQGRELDQPAIGIPGGEIDSAAAVRLVGAKPGHPGRGARQRPPQRLYLADV